MPASSLRPGRSGPSSCPQADGDQRRWLARRHRDPERPARVYLRWTREIRAEILQEVIGYWERTRAWSRSLSAREMVTLAGRVGNQEHDRSGRAPVPRRDGVVDVVEQLGFDVNDTHILPRGRAGPGSEPGGPSRRAGSAAGPPMSPIAPRIIWPAACARTILPLRPTVASAMAGRVTPGSGAIIEHDPGGYDRFGHVPGQQRADLGYRRDLRRSPARCRARGAPHRDGLADCHPAPFPRIHSATGPPCARQGRKSRQRARPAGIARYAGTWHSGTGHRDPALWSLTRRRRRRPSWPEEVRSHRRSAQRLLAPCSPRTTAAMAGARGDHRRGAGRPGAGLAYVTQVIRGPASARPSSGIIREAILRDIERDDYSACGADL